MFLLLSKNSTLISPISGTVTTVSGISPGENLTATSLGSNVIKVVDFNTLVFEASVDEVDFRKITLGQKVDVLLDAISDKKISGEDMDKMAEIIARMEQLGNELSDINEFFGIVTKENLFQKH